MKLFWLMAFCLATALAKTHNEQQCLQNCLAFTDQLKRAGSDVFPAEEAKTFCINSGIGSSSSDECKQIVSYSRKMQVLLKAGVPKRHACRKSCKTKVKGTSFNSPRSEKSCKTCKLVVKYVSLGIKIFKKTEGEIIDSVSHLCESLYNNETRVQQCKKIVGYVDEIFKLVLKGLAPGDICIKLEFCEGILKPLLLPVSASKGKTLIKANENRPCQLCQVLRDTIYDSSNDAMSTEERVEKAFKIICGQPVEKSCKDVKAMSKLMVIYVNAGVPKPRVCSKTCFGNATMEKKAVRSEKSCKICKEVVNYVSMGIKIFNQTEKEIIDSVSQLCTTFSSNETKVKECQKIVGYVDIVFQMVLKGLDVSQICVQLGFCNQMKRVLPFESRLTGLLNSYGNLMSYYARKASEVYEDFPAVIERYHKSESGKEVTSSSNGKACELCKTVTNIVYYSVKYANSTIEAIEEAIKVICNAQIGPVKKSCLFYLSKIDEIIQYIEKGLMPNDICVKLGFCNKTVHETNNRSWQNVHEDYETTARSVCRICHYTERIVKKDMRTFESGIRLMTKYAQIACISPINEDLKKKCSHVAKVLQSAEQLRKEILDPNECKKAICNKPFIIAMHIAKKTNNRVCDVCRYAENMLVKRFQNLDKIMEMSLSEVDKICDMIPYSRLSSRCHSYVNRTKTACDNIVEKLKSANLCVKLRLCPKQIEDEKEEGQKTGKGGKFFQHFFKGDGKNTICNLCMSSVRAVQAKIGRRRNVQKFAMPCGRLERLSGRKICSKFNLDAMIGRINFRESPAKFCKRMRQCDDKLPVAEIFTGIAGQIMKMFG